MVFGTPSLCKVLFISSSVTEDVFLYFALVEIWMMLNFGKYQYAEHYLKFLKFTCQLDLMKKSVAYQYCDNVTFVH